MDADLRIELNDFAKKSSGDRKTQVAACLRWPDGTKVFGTNRLKDDHGLTEQEITDRVKPKFYDAIRCAEAEAIDRASQLGLDLGKAELHSLMFPCQRCANKIVASQMHKVTA